MLLRFVRYLFHGSTVYSLKDVKSVRDGIISICTDWTANNWVIDRIGAVELESLTSARFSLTWDFIE